MSLTITEALAEIKTIQKRLEKKREFVTAYLARQEKVKDPLHADGGSFEAIRRERQAIRDLEQRIVDLRLAIAAANNQTPVAINGTTQSIAEWLVWRREVAPGQQQFLRAVRQQVQAARDAAHQRRLNVVSGGHTAVSDEDLVINVDETKLAAEIEALEEALGNLDGQLSLKNATVTIEG